MRSLTLLLILLSAACSSGSSTDTADQGGNNNNPPPGGGNNPGGGGNNNPPPQVGITLDDDAIPLGVAGGFPSDLVRADDGTLYTVSDATIPAAVVGFVGGDPVLNVPITANDLIDMDGTTPARAPTTFGTGLFGAFTGDLELARNRWLFVTVGAGNSLSSVRLANLVLIDTRTARVVQTINLAWTLDVAGEFSMGGTYLNVPQTLPVMCRYVPSSNGTPTGRVFVALSNGAGSAAGLGSFYAGTVQTWRVDFTQPQPLSSDLSGSPATGLTRTYVSEHYNPVGLTRYASARGVEFLLLTGAGASQFDQSGIVNPTTDAVLEVLDLDTGDWRPEWTMNLGRILPAPQGLALGRDLSGNHFAMLTSQTYARAYVVELTGLESNPVDPARLGLRRTIDLGDDGEIAGSGFQPGIALSATGLSAVVSSFSTAALTVIDLPGDVLSQPFVLSPSPFDGDLSSAEALGLGAVVFLDDSVFVVVNGNFDANFLPARSSFLGVLNTEGRLP